MLDVPEDVKLFGLNAGFRKYFLIVGRPMNNLRAEWFAPREYK